MSGSAKLLAALFAAVAAIQVGARAFYGVVLHDQADLVLFAQDWRPVHDEQVPIYAWGMWLTMRLTGWAVWAPDALKLAFLGLALSGLYRAGRNLGGAAAGLVSALSLVLLPTGHDDLLREATHSAGVIAFAALSFAVMTAPPARRSGWPLALSWCGGLLMKHNMLIVMASQVGAARMAGARSGPMPRAAAIAAALAAPAYLVLATDLGAVRGGTAEFVTSGGGGGRWRGLGDLASSVLGEGALMFVLLGAAYAVLRRAGHRTTRAERMLLLTVPLAVAAYAVIVALGDVGTVRDRWLAPSLVALSPVAGSWIARGASVMARTHVTTAMAAALVALAIYRAILPAIADGTGQDAMAARPYVRIADRLASAAADADVIVFADEQLAATAKVRHPHLLTYAGRTRGRIPPGAERFLLAGHADGADPAWMTQLIGALDCAPPDLTRWNYRFSNPARYVLTLRRCVRPA